MHWQFFKPSVAMFHASLAIHALDIFKSYSLLPGPAPLVGIAPSQHLPLFEPHHGELALASSVATAAVS